MATNKVGLKTVTETMNDYMPIYRPLYSMFLDGKSQQHTAEVGNAVKNSMKTIGDIRAKHITPKDTELKQVAVSSGSRTFKKYFLANQFTISHQQSQEDVNDTISQVLDEHQIQMDEMIFLGEGTAANNVVNNGLFWSGDENYKLNSSAEVDTDVDSLIGLNTSVLSAASDAENIAGRKVILFYGSDVLTRFNGLYESSNTPFKTVLKEVLEEDFSLAKVPSQITPSGANGFIIVNVDQVKLHYTKLPALEGQGSNDEKMHYWFNFLMGSAMLEVLALNAIIRQPITFEA